MTNSQICLKAAEMIDSRQAWASCVALENAGASVNLIDRYQSLFANKLTCDVLWLSSRVTSKSGGRRLRVLMLCFMAAVCSHHR